MTIDELLCKFQGKCWHTVMQEADVQRIIPVSAICVCGAIFENNGSIKRHIKDSNPDFSSDHAAMELYRWFSTSKEDMFTEFEEYMDISTYDFIKFKEVDGKNYMRWVVLLGEWLRLEEVREKWGWEECPTCWRPGDYTGALPVFCPTCNGSGKVPAPWLKERRKG